MAKMMSDKPVEKMGDTSVTIPVTEPAVVQSETAEPALAIGLPETWSIEPPAVVVRRKVRTL